MFCLALLVVTEVSGSDAGGESVQRADDESAKLFKWCSLKHSTTFTECVEWESSAQSDHCRLRKEHDAVQHAETRERHHEHLSVIDNVKHDNHDLGSHENTQKTQTICFQTNSKAGTQDGSGAQKKRLGAKKKAPTKKKTTTHKKKNFRIQTHICMYECMNV